MLVDFEYYILMIYMRVADLHGVGVLLQLVVDLRRQDERLRLLKAVTDSNKTQHVKPTGHRLRIKLASLVSVISYTFIPTTHRTAPSHLQNTVHGLSNGVNSHDVRVQSKIFTLKWFYGCVFPSHGNILHIFPLNSVI